MTLYQQSRALMTTLSIADLFKIDVKRYFQLDPTKYMDSLTRVSLADVPEVKDRETFVGIEVEMENCTGAGGGLVDIFWIWKGDGSLRNNGAEAVSWPVRGEWIRYALKVLWDSIKKVSFSARTSIHVHVDVRAFSQKQLTAVILVYLAVESLLYKFVGKDRHDNIYCVPLYTTTLVNSLVDLLNKSIAKHNFSVNRYAGLNLDALRKFGTLEFRQLHGTHDVAKVMTWINLIFKIFRYAAKNDVDSLLSKIIELNTNSLYISFVNEVFEEMAGSLDLLDLKSDLEKGVKAVKQATISNKFAHELRKEFSRKSPAAKRYKQLHKGEYVEQYFQLAEEI